MQVREHKDRRVGLIRHAASEIFRVDDRHQDRDRVGRRCIDKWMKYH